MKISLGWLGRLMLVAGLFAGTLLSGCGGGSASDPGNQLFGNFSGVYSSTTDVVTVTTNGAAVTITNIVPVGGAMVSTNSGPAVTQLTLTQAQSQLRAVDNNGDVFTGTFSVAYAYGGMVQMDGVIGGGTPVHIEGYLESSGSTAWLNASWIEPNLTGSMYGTAQVTPFSPSNSAAWMP